MADTVGIIREGELVFQDTLETLRARSQHQLALRTTDNQAAGELLGRCGLEVRQEGEFLRIPLREDGDTARLTALLAQRQIGLLRLEERQKSLEDIFLELTGKAASL